VPHFVISFHLLHIPTRHALISFRKLECIPCTHGMHMSNFESWSQIGHSRPHGIAMSSAVSSFIIIQSSISRVPLSENYIADDYYYHSSISLSSTQRSLPCSVFWEYEESVTIPNYAIPATMATVTNSDTAKRYITVASLCGCAPPV
jgi:hypothetical protein